MPAFANPGGVARSILVMPERELDLGIVGPDERIVREIEGTKVVGARVVKA
ncbi:hypothetical protein [Bradyrhizobium liaoningense]